MPIKTRFSVTGLTTDEAVFMAKYPLDALKIYRAAQKAIRTTWKTLKSRHHYEDDETDAFRHFFWAGLSAREIGLAKAKEFLDAHENFAGNNPKAKAMDLFNNNKGLEFAANYKGGDFERDLIRAGVDKIMKMELRWIK